MPYAETKAALQQHLDKLFNQIEAERQAAIDAADAKAERQAREIQGRMEAVTTSLLPTLNLEPPSVPPMPGASVGESQP